MFMMYSLRQTTRFPLVCAFRSQFSTSTSNSNDADRLDASSTKKSNTDSVAPNILLEAKRIQQERNEKTNVTQTEKDSAKTETIRKQEVVPSSGFSAFLRSISSGLPFFPSNKSFPTVIDFATTREYFIPLTRPSLIRLLATKSDVLEDNNDHLLFHQICHGFDSAVSHRYQTILNELKHLFDPLNPDNETLENRRVAYRDRLDNEYWLLRKLNDILHRANFIDLPPDVIIDKFLLHEDSLSSANLQIRIDGHDYDILKFWIMGREQMMIEDTSRLRRFFRRPTSTTLDYFKRVIVAIRLKGHDRLYLKAFRDIPLQSLTKLVPIGKLKLAQFEKKLLATSAILGSTTLATNLVLNMADYHVPGLLFSGTTLSLAMALWSLRSFYQSKISYLSSMNQVMFYKNIASNKQLLSMIVDRAHDELCKEVLLVYMFIQLKQKQSVPLTIKNLELEIENWIQSTTNSSVSFNSSQAIEFLRQLGIIHPEDSKQPGCIQALPFKEVTSILPKVSHTLIEKKEEWDLIEGYDKKYFEVDWKTVMSDDETFRKSGWR